MATMTTHGFPAPSQSVAPVSMGTQHLQTFLNMYFNPNYVKGTERRDHFQLADASADQIFEDAGKVIRNISIEHLMWINTQLLPARVTRKLEMEVTVLRFDRGFGPEQTPNEAVSRYIDIQRETVSFRSKRYGMAMYFEVDRMMTPEGQEEFALFTKEIAKRFRQHAAYVAMARFLQPHASEQMWYPQYNAHPQNITEDQIRREVVEFAAPHKSETGAFQLIWSYAKVFERFNGVKPDFVIFHSEKQALFKFNNKLLNEYYRGGPDAPGRVLDPEEIANIQGMSFREFPVFPAQCYNSTEDAENSMNSHDVEIGNFFVFRRSAFENVPDFRNGVHNYIEIFSENKDGLYRIHERDLLRNSGRFDENGNLHPDHQEMCNDHRPGQAAIDDLFMYMSGGRARVVEYLGEMSHEHLTEGILTSMVSTIKRDLHDVDAVRGALNYISSNEVLDDGDGLGVYESQLYTIRQFFSHLSRRLGGAKNDLFSNRSDLYRLYWCGLFRPSENDLGPNKDGREAWKKCTIWLRTCLIMGGADKPTIDVIFGYLQDLTDPGPLDGDDYDSIINVRKVLATEIQDLMKYDFNPVDFLGRIRDKDGLLSKLTATDTTDKDRPRMILGFIRGLKSMVGVYKRSPYIGINRHELSTDQAVHTYVDPVECTIALAILNTNVHLSVFESMLSFNIQLPFEYIILRPFHSLLMSDLVLAKGGTQLGETLIGYGHTGIGWKIVNKTGDLHCTQWMGAYIRDYGLRCIIRNAFHERSYGGGGHKFFTEDEYRQHVENGFHTEGYDRPSLLGVMIPIGSYVKDDYIHLMGYMSGETGRPHYQSYQYYTRHYEFTKIQNTRPTVIYEDANSVRTNVICFQGTQRQCGNVNGDPGVITENKGHLGIERTGDREVRCHGLKLKPVLSGQQITA